MDKPVHLSTDQLAGSSHVAFAAKDLLSEPDIDKKALEYTCYITWFYNAAVLVWEVMDESKKLTYSFDSKDVFKGKFTLSNLDTTIKLKIISCKEGVLVQPEEATFQLSSFDHELFYQASFLLKFSEQNGLQNQGFVYEIIGNSCSMSMHFNLPNLPKELASPPITMSSLTTSKRDRSASKTKTIGKDGGKIEFEEYDHCYIEFPPGSLNGEVHFTIKLLIATKDKKSSEFILTPTLDCYPSMKFAKPVTISLPTCYTPDNAVIEIVPQTLEDDEWKDEESIWHAGEKYIVFTTSNFSRKRVRANRMFGRFPIKAKNLQFICYLHPRANQLCLTWNVQDKISNFANKLKKDEVLRGMFTLEKNKRMNLSIEGLHNSISVQPPSYQLFVKFNEDCFWEENFLIETSDQSNASALLLCYCIKDRVRNIRNGFFPLSAASALKFHDVVHNQEQNCLPSTSSQA